MITVKCYYENGNTITTGFNGTFEQAKQYFVDQWFNFGTVTDNLQRCVKIEQI